MNIESFYWSDMHEDPALVISPQSSKSFIGGAGIVAARGSTLGAIIKLLEDR